MHPCQRSKYERGKYDERKEILNTGPYLRFLVALGSTLHIIMSFSNVIRNVEGVGCSNRWIRGMYGSSLESWTMLGGLAGDGC